MSVHIYLAVSLDLYLSICPREQTNNAMTLVKQKQRTESNPPPPSEVAGRHCCFRKVGALPSSLELNFEVLSKECGGMGCGGVGVWGCGGAIIQANLSHS